MNNETIANILRGALMEVKRSLQYLYKPERAPFDGDNRRIVDTVRIIDAVLAAPPRNCDIGTEGEQSRRFDKFCFAHMTYESGCGDCPLLQSVCCELAWSQMSYEKEVDDGR